eukprot:3019636-Rhodomonas_salina.7
MSLPVGVRLDDGTVVLLRTTASSTLTSSASNNSLNNAAHDQDPECTASAEELDDMDSDR